MRDQDIYDLLMWIDVGYVATEEEKNILKSVETIKWRTPDGLPRCMELLTSVTRLDLEGTVVNDISALGGLSSLRSLKLNRTIVSDISGLSELTSLINLELSETEVSDISALSELTSLKYLDLSRTRVSDISALSGLTSLTRLDLSRTEVGDISALREIATLKSLNLEGTEVSDIGALSGLISLKSLNLGGTGVSDIGALSGLISLKSLDLCLTRVSDIRVLRGLTSLTFINMNATEVNDISALRGLTELSELYLWRTNVSDISALHGLSSLTNINLCGTKVKDIGALSGLTSLTSLSLSDTEISDISALKGLISLKKLALNRSKVSDISALRRLTELTYLDLRHLILNAIPEWLLDLKLNFVLQEYNLGENGIAIYGLKLKDQPVEIFGQSRELIHSYYKEHKNVPINECKVVFLGDGGAGKSLIIDRLMKDGKPSPSFDGVSTPGIKITSKKYQIRGDEIELHFWDFGGQAVMHSMHRLFLTNRTLYVIVTNARDNKANEQAWYWIRNIKSFAKGAPVLLLINQKDQNPSANINETGLRKEYPQIKGVSIVSAKEDTTEEFNKFIRDEICKIVSEMESVHTPFPKSWHMLMDDLQEMKTDYIDSKEFRKKCKDKGIDIKQDILDQIISWYQDLGVCFYSKKNPYTGKYMVLKPKWLLNALYILSFNGRKYAKNGIIQEEDIYKLICEPVPYKDIKKVWSDISYEPDEIQYIINVLLNFNLVHRIDSEQFFVPMLCDENEPTVIDNFETEDAIHVSFKYEYLPENVLHRLMVLHGFELNRDLVWKTGAVLERKRLGWQALARSKDNCIDVYAKASDQETHPINSYLDIIRESVYRINSDFGLAAEEYITYAKDGKTDEFEYRWLEESKNAGLNEVYSRVFKARIRIDEIIGVIKSPNLLQSNIDYIYECVISACKQIQARKIYWNKPDHIVSEDDRNDGMRDLISSRGLFVRDQTHAGRGQEGKNPGEVDLMIMNSPTDAQALIEAMVLSVVNTKYIKEHLDKLVDGYNDSGFRDLFLVSYVELERSKFSSFWNRYKNKVKELGTENFTVNTSVIPQEDESLAWIKSIKITYDYAGEDIRVYHICARVAE